MQPQRAERLVQGMSVIGIWMAFLAGWAFKSRQMPTFSSFGADLPTLTLMWLELADSLFALAIPAIATLLIAWLFRRRSAHLNWVAGSVLFIGLIYGVFVQTVAILPTFKLCGGPV